MNGADQALNSGWYRACHCSPVSGPVNPSGQRLYGSSMTCLTSGSVDASARTPGQRRQRAARKSADTAGHRVHHPRTGAAVPLDGRGLQQQGAQVAGDRVEPGAVDDSAAGSLRIGVVPLDHLRHELGLAGQVAVVGARFDAGPDHALAVLRVRTDRRRDHLGRPSELCQRVGVRAVRDQDRGIPHLGRKGLELGPIPAGDGPSQVGVALCEDTGDPGSDESSGSVEDDLVRAVSLRAHRPRAVR